MSETLHNIFGRARNDLPAPEEQAATATALQEAPDTNVIDAEQADDGPSVEDVTEDVTEDVADDAADDAESADAESTDDAEDSASDDSDADDSDDSDVDAADEDAADEDVESADATDEPSDSTEVLDDDEVTAEDTTPVTVVPVTVESGAAAETVAEAETEARPAAGTRGSTTVGDGVVSKVVTMVAGKVDGVHSLDEEGSSVAVDAGVVSITIALVVEYGHAVKALAEQLRVDVIDAVEQFLGLDVAAVDVHVSDIHYPETV